MTKMQHQRKVILNSKITFSFSKENLSSAKLACLNHQPNLSTIYSLNPTPSYYELNAASYLTTRFNVHSLSFSQHML